MDGGRVIHFGRVDFRNDLKLGGLAFYGADRGEIFPRTAGYVDRILRGEKPMTAIRWMRSCERMASR
jgi:hypothetical protein